MNKELKTKLVNLITEASLNERYYWGRLMEEDGEDRFGERYNEAKAYLSGVNAVINTLKEST